MSCHHHFIPDILIYFLMKLCIKNIKNFKLLLNKIVTINFKTDFEIKILLYIQPFYIYMCVCVFHIV